MPSRTNHTVKRHSFSRSPSVFSMPNLLGVQIDSFRHFMQLDVPEDQREPFGLEEVLRNVFPIEDTHRNYILEYKSYYFGLPKYKPHECLERGVTYAVPLKVRLILHITDEFDRSKYAHSIEQDVYFGNVPFMTDRGTFIINGAERIVVSQLQRSPGVFFDDFTHPNGTKLFQARVIPFRGSWIDFTTDIRDCIFVIIDRRRKFPVTTLLRSLGFSENKDIFRAFNLLISSKLDARSIKKIEGNYLVEDIVNFETGEIIAESGVELTEDLILELKANKVKELKCVNPEDDLAVELLTNTMIKDPTENTEESLRLMYKHLRSGEPPNLETAQKFVERIFFSPKRYDLGKVGRYRLNKQFDLDVSLDHTVLTTEDLICVIEYLMEMRKGLRGSDDIDHLGNRRMKTVGEQLTNQFSVALNRMARTIRERMNLREAESLTPQDLINSRVVTTVINSFFGTSQLSQFMDQTNPLAEITHKRRVSALGPGGMTRERAGFEVRDVHYTHYGRLCPIETPEGPNIGLISSLSTYAQVNDLGFIEAPYRVVTTKNGDPFVTSKTKYLSAEDEDRSRIAQAMPDIGQEGKIEDEKVRVRIRGDFPVVKADEVQFTDVAPYQILSVAAALIPFLEHDDANRALMGSNMQRQSVPLINPDAPIVGTGMEKTVAEDSMSCLYSPVTGVVEQVDAKSIVIKTRHVPEDLAISADENRVRIPLMKYSRTNQDTCMNQRPVVREKEKVYRGDLIADGPSNKNGELALGKNILVAFMPWRGYNFEDAIVISERLIKDDVFTSIHISEVDLEVRDTKRGEEELTREIPNVGDEATKDLDEDGIIREGARVQAGDILIGKITPKGETDPTPEEKLLRAIFGEKAGDVKDASKRAEPGINGVVVRTQLFERKSKATRAQEKKIIGKLQEETRRAKRRLKKTRDEHLIQLLTDQICGGLRDVATGKTIIKASTKLTSKRLANLDLERISRDNQWVNDRNVWIQIQQVWNSFNSEWRRTEEKLDREIYRLQVGDELQPGVSKLTKVYIANRRKVQVGDKMAGRHGNKGVVAVVVPEEDMPFLDDGTPVDLVLNPLGVPSRMNLGQLYETMLGWAGQILGVHYETPPFDSATPEQVKEELRKANLPETGKIELKDGITGEYFDYPVTIGYIYMMKLNHMIDDKMHARSTGPYSLITQQPLGGKAQFGGQRLGEMEVWALEAYGASYALQEMLTGKSDDVEGRSRVYNSIVRGDNIPSFSIPESFNVLVKELQGLGVDVQLHN
ncbi:MAG: DNA-directed RNA polymerase subunit beta [Candidatus Marinimicrobia bacterium]|nr:DNA-directed RNA polymerase subunit beta [Candidatus Neomarinimicrobiota bacterium]